jgi:hypothetical protein
VTTDFLPEESVLIALLMTYSSALMTYYSATDDLHTDYIRFTVLVRTALPYTLLTVLVALLSLKSATVKQGTLYSGSRGHES